jgi:F0F1-type ATP synthase assembly protein I
MPEAEDRDEKIKRLEAELQKEAKNLFTHRPDPGPIPEVLQHGPSVPKPDSKPSEVAGMAKAWGIALDFVFTILAGAAVGWLIDRWLKSNPVGLLIGLALGFAMALVRIIRTTQKQEAADRARKGGF